ncbi:MAG TPA: arylesterase [Thermoanaerobaculia bacterium]|nr:arylesterase [Thermoanaerobaculia bacterium]
MVAASRSVPRVLVCFAVFVLAAGLAVLMAARGPSPATAGAAAAASPFVADLAPAPGSPSSSGDARSSAATTAAWAPLVVFLGDSLTAGHGVAEDQAFPAVAAARLAVAGHPVRVLNAGVSGDTSAGGLRRLEWLLAQDPDVIVVSLGANDGLRGLPLADTEANLRRIVSRAREAGARVLLLGMRMPPNYGPEYAPHFAALYPLIAEELEVPLVPFLLEGVGGRPELNQADGIHPTVEGHRIMAATILPWLQTIVGELGPRARRG